MKYCSKHHKNPDDAVFCNECGERLTRVTNTNHICPKCGASNPTDAKFCHSCGCSFTNIPEPKPIHPPISNPNPDSTRSSHKEMNQFIVDYDVMKSYFGSACMWFVSAIFSGCVLNIVGCILYGSLMGGWNWVFVIICDIISFLCTWGVMKLDKTTWVIWKWMMPISIFVTAASSGNIALRSSYPPLFLIIILLLVIGFWGTIVITKKKSYYFH